LLASGGALVAAAPAWAAATGGSGASLPYTEVQAENSATNGTIIGPSYTQGQLADEASYRKAVTLKGAGQYVTFTTPVATNSINFRYSIPDSSDGSVYTAPLSLYVNGTKQTDFTLTNAYSWYYGSYPFTNTPGSGNPHHFFDETHRLLPTTYPAGTTFQAAGRLRGHRSLVHDRLRRLRAGRRRADPARRLGVGDQRGAPTRPARPTPPAPSMPRSPRPARAARCGSRRARTTSRVTSASTT